MVQQFLAHGMHDVFQEGAEHSGDCRETAGTETVPIIKKVEKIVEGTPVVILVSSGGCAIESQCGVPIIQK